MEISTTGSRVYARVEYGELEVMHRVVLQCAKATKFICQIANPHSQGIEDSNQPHAKQAMSMINKTVANKVATSCVAIAIDACFSDALSITTALLSLAAYVPGPHSPYKNRMLGRAL